VPTRCRALGMECLEVQPRFLKGDRQRTPGTVSMRLMHDSPNNVYQWRAAQHAWTRTVCLFNLRELAEVRHGAF
jgi:hypothetical protein